MQKKRPNPKNKGYANNEQLMNCKSTLKGANTKKTNAANTI